MGLDMMLYSVKKDRKSAKKVKELLDTNANKFPVYEVAYWRKFYTLHGLFVSLVQNGTDDCLFYQVTYNDVQSILNEMLSLQSSLVNADIVKTNYGDYNFYADNFVCDDDMDMWLFIKVCQTIGVLRTLLNTFDFEKNYLFYCSSW